MAQSVYEVISVYRSAKTMALLRELCRRMSADLGRPVRGPEAAHEAINAALEKYEGTDVETGSQVTKSETAG